MNKTIGIKHSRNIEHEATNNFPGGKSTLMHTSTKSNKNHKMQAEIKLYWF